jgi:hypothetical protein
MPQSPYPAPRPTVADLLTVTPRCVQVSVQVPDRLFIKSIDDTVSVAASRLRWLLAQEYQAQVKERFAARYSGA